MLRFLHSYTTAKICEEKFEFLFTTEPPPLNLGVSSALGLSPSFGDPSFYLFVNLSFPARALFVLGVVGKGKPGKNKITLWRIALDVEIHTGFVKYHMKSAIESRDFDTQWDDYEGDY